MVGLQTVGLLGIVALVAVWLVWLIGRTRRKSTVITHAELVKRVKRLS